jgi:uncharacterized protein (DUF1015 family)
VPRVEPFRALRYVESPSRPLARLIAPPYDVISPELRARLAADPHNIVHIDLPEAPGGADPYAAAAHTLAGWVRDGALARDREPSFYLCEQEFRSPSGPLLRRRGVFARLGLEPLDTGVVIPHERTLDGPRADRLRLLERTGTYVSPVFLLHPDPRASLAGYLALLTQAPPDASLKDGDGVGIRVWRVVDRDAVARIAGLLREDWVLIADGHHRYESALELRRARGGEGPDWILSYLCSLEDPGVAILPIHRLIHSVPGFAPDAVRARLAPWFDLEAVQPTGALPAALASRRGRPGVYGLAFAGETGSWLAVWKEGAGLDRPGLAALPPPLRGLDVILLHRLVLEEALGIGIEAQARQEHLEFVKDADQLLARVSRGQMGVLLNPTRIDQVIEVSRAGLRLPQKSTYFHPKVPTGLVLDPIDD